MTNLKKLTVEEYTSPNIMTASKEDLLIDLDKIMKDKNIRHMPIVENGKVVGVLSQRDLYKVDKNELDSINVDAIMTKEPYLVSKSELLHDVAYHMSSKKIGSAIVTEGNKIFGIFTTTDALNALVEVMREEL